jgi:1-acyl-sn-glycerol-3-phosphate acyltransferase
MLDKPVVLLSKHQSAWETVAYVALMPKPLCFVFKRELLLVPFFGWALGMLKMVHINRKDGPRAFASAARQGRDRLAEGAWIIMFPEGTRTASGLEKPLQERRRPSGGGNRCMGYPDGCQFGTTLAPQLLPEISGHDYDFDRRPDCVGQQDRRHAESGSRNVD